VPHGIAVAYGIDLANMIASKLGLIDISLRNRIRPILQDVFDICPIPQFEIDSYLEALMKDKKNTGGKLNAIMTRGLGDMYQTPVELTDEIKNLISNFFKFKLYEKNT
jgi:3-dehydroquinate synthase